LWCDGCDAACYELQGEMYRIPCEAYSSSAYTADQIALYPSTNIHSQYTAG